MKTSQLPIYLSVLLCFLLNTAMIAPSETTYSTEKQSKLEPTKGEKKRFRKFQKIKKRVFKRLRKVTGVEDGRTLLIALGAVIIGGVLVYYLFQMGFFAGLLALVAVVFILYLLFRYLNY